jgi:hypothetical protein
MRLMRLTYGRSGSMLRKVLLAAPPARIDRKSHWSLYILVAVWISIPVVASLVVAPGAKQGITLVDTSRLAVPPPTVAPAPENKTEAPAPPKVEKTSLPPPPAPAEREPRPVIVRRAATVQEEPVPRIQRVNPLRSRGDTTEAATKAYIPRQRSVTEAPAAGAVVTRSRGLQANETPVPAAPAVRRRALQSVPDDAALPQPRATRPRAQPEAEQPIARIAPQRTSVDPDGAAARAVGAERGVSLATLEVCGSQQQEERGIKAVLSVIGSRQVCSSGKGLFVFKGTQRVSSFNLFISPADGRRLSNRCEELENAYRCLKEN